MHRIQFGLFLPWELIRVPDKNGNITDKWNPSDKRYFGVDEPKYRGNISTYFAWKDLSVNLSFAYQWGGQQYNETLLNKVEVTNGEIDGSILEM